MGIKDEEYSRPRCKFSNDEKEILTKSDIIIQQGLLPEEKISVLKENQILIGALNSYDNKEKIDALIKKELKFFH